MRLVGDNIVPEVYDIVEALKIAREMELDLVEINASISPPICKVIDYKKFSFDQSKKQKKLKNSQDKSPMKEIRLGPDTDEHDFNHRISLAFKFLEKGKKVKVSMSFKGRAIHTRVDEGKLKLSKFANELEKVSKIELIPALEGNRLHMILASLVSKKK